MKLVRWTLSIGIGALFGWLTLKDGHFAALLNSDVIWQDGYLLSGRSSPVASTAISNSMPPLEEGWQISIVHVLGYLVALGVIHVLRAIRWEPLIRPLLSNKLSLARLNAISAVGFMAIFLLPLRLGEFVRPYLVKKERPDTSMSSLLGSVALERIADGLVVTLFLFLALPS